MPHKFGIRSLLKLLEDPKHPSAGPNLRLLSLTGIWHPSVTLSTRFKQFIFFVIVLFFLSQYVKLFINFNAESFKMFLRYTAFHLGILKAGYFEKDHKLWDKLISYISSVECDQLSKNDKNLDRIIKEYIHRNRKFTYLYWALGFSACINTFSEPYKYNQFVENGTSIYTYVFDGYTPFEKEPPGYYATMAIQSIFGWILSAYILSWDGLVVCLMIFFAGQLRIARIYCSQIITGDDRQSHENIAEFHRFYINLVKNQRKFNSMISSVMFAYLIVFSVNLGFCIIQIAETDEFRNVVTGCVYIFASLVQLLVIYWHSNEVTIESMSVSYGVFESDWVGTDKLLQKKMALLGVTTTKRLVFKAGPFKEMSLTTFVDVLRASYSYYALLKETN